MPGQERVLEENVMNFWGKRDTVSMKVVVKRDENEKDDPEKELRMKKSCTVKILRLVLLNEKGTSIYRHRTSKSQHRVRRAIYKCIGVRCCCYVLGARCHFCRKLAEKSPNFNSLEGNGRSDRRTGTQTQGWRHVYFRKGQWYRKTRTTEPKSFRRQKNGEGEKWRRGKIEGFRTS